MKILIIKRESKKQNSSNDWHHFINHLLEGSHSVEEERQVKVYLGQKADHIKPVQTIHEESRVLNTCLEVQATTTGNRWTNHKLERFGGIKSKSRPSKNLLQVVPMLVMVVTVFIFCWTPILIFEVLQSYNIIGTQVFRSIKHVKTCFSLLAYGNRKAILCIYL